MNPSIGEIVAVQSDARSEISIPALVREIDNRCVTVQFAAGNTLQLPRGSVSSAPPWMLAEYRQMVENGHIS